MPRNVRNFWLELQVDGRKSEVKTGPRRKDGGFSQKVFIREKGLIQCVGELSGIVDGGLLWVRWSPSGIGGKPTLLFCCER